ncbi:MAG: hypothetical protein HY782_27035 [Chloroflexi bacterium]|nr:hypothetical protein [Chloroflexota bacterium]
MVYLVLVQRSLALALFAFVFAAYMVTYTRALDLNADAGTMFAVTESMVKFARTSIDQANNMQYVHPGVIGPDGSRYSKYGLGQSLAAVPFYAIGLIVPAFGLVDVTLLPNPLAGALSAAVLFVAALELGASRPRALAVALLYALCTSTWVYAKGFGSEPLSELGFAVACWGMAILLTRQEMRGAALAGFGVGLAILARSSVAVAAPVLLLVALRYGGPRRWRMTFAAAVPMIATVSVIAFYNWLRFGNPAQSGYGDESFTVAPWVGAWGMLFSPGHGLFIYAPIMIAAVPGLWMLRKPAGLRVWLIGTVLVVLLLHGAWWSWWGGWSYGPRLLVSMMPLLSIGLSGIQVVAKNGTRINADERGFYSFYPRFPRLSASSFVRLTGLGFLAGLSFLMQLLGALVSQNVFYWQVMATVPDVDPDVASLNTLEFFMPLTNLSEVLRGCLDVAWKPGVDSPFDYVGLLFVVSGLLIGAIGLGLAWRGGRAAGYLSALAVIGVALGMLAHYYQAEENPYRALGAAAEACAPPDALLLFGDDKAYRTRLVWQVNRSTRRIVGVSPDKGQMQMHALPHVYRALQTGQPIWYIQTEDSPPADLWGELEWLNLCSVEVLTDAGARLVEWTPCK